MNPYIGDRPLDPPDDPDECETCGGVNPFDCMDCCYEYDEDPGEPNEEPDL